VHIQVGRVRKSFLFSAGVAWCSAIWASPASAQGFAVNQFEPAERGSEAFVLDTLDFRGRVRPAVGLTGDWAHQPLAIYDTNGDVRSAIVKDQAYLHLGASVVLWERLRFGLNVPVQVVANGQDGTLRGTPYFAPSTGFAFGDLRLAADVRLVGRYGDAFRLAAGVRGWLPTGDQAAYAGDGSGRFGGHLMAAGDIGGHFVYAVKAGATYRGQDAVIAGGALGSDLVGGAFAGLRYGPLVAGPEVFGRTVLANSGGFTKRATPVEGLLGAHYQIGAFRIGGGLGTGFTRGYGSPSVRGLLSFEWSPAFEAPAQLVGKPGDQDGDGVPDEDDACPDVKGVKTDDPRTNGCPADKDGDGVPDNLDACPDVAGVKTMNPKTSGCQPDSDGDGFIDADDACPDVPGIKTDDPKTNGCAPPDRDNDGIPDSADACPDVAGKPDADPKKNGCPEVVVVPPPPLKIPEQVRFAVGSATVGKEGGDLLEQVRAMLVAHPEIKKVRVEGHADTQEAGRAAKQLSVDRAGSVVRWLIAHKIEPSRLTSEGFGAERPTDSNDNPDGRKANRRVEFQIVEQGAPPANSMEF
jgi:outer membrane protein OmpA-like peptidoglycan-associated protein